MNMSNSMNNFSNPNYLWNNPNQFSFSPSPYNNYNNYLNNNHNNTTQPTQQTSNNIIWVKGKENARSMQLPPNSTVILLDSEIGKFYIKTTDDIGLGKLRIFSYMEQPDIDSDNSRNNQVNTELDLSNYVTKNEFQQAIKEIRKYEQSLSTIEQTKQQQSSRKQSKAINKQF